MVSASKAKRLAKKAAEKDTKKGGSSVDQVADGVAALSMKKGNGSTSELDAHLRRTVTGVLTSLKTSRDVKVEGFALSSFGKVLISETTFEVNFGRRYGLLGENGSGKTTLMHAIASREVPIPEHIDIYLLNEPAPPTDMTGLQWVLDEANKELKRLEDLADKILVEEGPDDPNLQDIYERIDAMDPSTFESRVSSILYGLGFDSRMMPKATKDMSGGWRMRVALAKALFVRPTLLLLDEPTAHLDLGACVWLERYLAGYDRILVIVSHSQDFLNGVCTDTIDLRKQKLMYYGGNYDTYVRTRQENETNQMKQYHKQQEEIAHIKQFIASCGTYANWSVNFRFPDMPKLPPPVLGFDSVCFAYSGDLKDALYMNLNLGVDMDSRIALVGPNGVGKSTLLKLLMGTLQPQDGRVQRHSSLKIGLYSQHSADQLDMEKSSLEFLRDKYPHISQDFQYWRTQIGRFGLTKDAQTAKIGTLSEGQRSRIVFCMLAIDSPHMLLLDEPTNGLDMNTIDALAEAINNFSGGVVVVSHDFRLLDKIAKDILVCENKNIRRWEGDIQSYKRHLANQVDKVLAPSS
ncbi:ATP-binding cassette sub-family F member 2 [Catenaria anguillulae PL171]|uniref:ATP-binding cassette sub-family F member 2 n=1 Tax=Catenaria anguillulae PL171 TaxID=765915 RepID=A0A1Y2I0P4_9FUNG|nr:ATP-binding cassette sub-family F member 2 [Catenaria anguillulae PL171]